MGVLKEFLKEILKEILKVLLKESLKESIRNPSVSVKKNPPFFARILVARQREKKLGVF